MDMFFEQLVVRRPKKSEMVVKALMILFGVFAVLLLIFMAFFRLFGFLSFLCVPAALGIAVALYFSVKNTYIEYEYSITNGELDIDKIRGKRKRERMISVSCADFTEFGVYDEKVANRLKQREFGGRAFAANHDSDNLFYAVARHKKFGEVLIVMEPNERVITALKKFIPRRVQGDVLAGYGHSED